MLVQLEETPHCGARGRFLNSSVDFKGHDFELILLELEEGVVLDPCLPWPQRVCVRKSFAQI
ncbi:hypothetical protein DVH24_039699 [Malus domestica]|uniref:Uncharacterized protein n=1 Tax=Malus domestica TaxID=3750 RepID=A0A498I1L2_MALDO|nr:hypothetical protein DVH24_039699 [Malus domestica]